MEEDRDEAVQNRLDRGDRNASRCDFSSAIADYSKAIFLDPNCAHAYAQRARVYVNLGDLQSAFRNLSMAVSLSPGDSALRAELARAGDALGFSLLQDQLFDEAVAALSTAIQHDELCAAYRVHRAMALVGAGQFAAASADLDTAIAVDATQPDLLVLRAKVRWRLGLEQQGNADIRRAYAIDPAHPEIKAFEASLWGKAEREYALAASQALQGDLPAALVSLQRALDFSPNDVKALALRASVLRRLGRLTDSLRDLDEASALYGRMRGAAAAADRPRASVTRAVSGADEHPELRKQRSLTLNAMALVHMREARWGAAVRLLNAVVEAETEGAREAGPHEAIDPRFLVNRGDCHRQRGALQQALADYHAAHDLAPDDWEIATRLSLVHHLFGVSLFNQGEYTQAEVEFSTAIRCNGKISAYFLHRGDALYQQRRFAAAHADYQRAVELDPANTTAQAKLRQFAPLRSSAPAHPSRTMPPAAGPPLTGGPEAEDAPVPRAERVLVPRAGKGPPPSRGTERSARGGRRSQSPARQGFWKAAAPKSRAGTRIARAGSQSLGALRAAPAIGSVRR